MKTLILKVTEKQMNLLDKQKERTGVSKANIVRLAIDQYLGGIFE